MKKSRFALTCLALILISCINKNDNSSGFFCAPKNNDIDLRVDSLALECIRPEVAGLSYVGFSGIRGDKLFFADALFSCLHQFDKDLDYQGLHIQYGNGPHEIPVSRFEAYCVSDEGHHYFLDSSTNVYEFDEQFDLVNQVFYYWSKKISEGDTPELTDSYATAWGNINLTVHDGMLYTNISGESEDFNIGVPEYYQVARIIEPRDAKTGVPSPMLGRISPSVGYMTAFQKDFFCVSPVGNFIVAYEADDLIYVYDPDYKIKYSYGQPGKNMNRDYQELSFENFRNDLEKEMEIRGRYTSLSVVDNLTFRTYITGSPLNETRLQIYDKTTMIGDVQVPDGFKVLGYIEPYYYSEFICNEDDETIVIYRFKL